MKRLIVVALMLATASCSKSPDVAASASPTPATTTPQSSKPATPCPVEITHSTGERGVSVRADATTCTGPLSDVMARIEAGVPSLGSIHSIVIVGPDSEEGYGEIRSIWNATCLRHQGRGRDVSKEDFLQAYRASKLSRTLVALMASHGAHVEPTAIDNFYVIRKDRPVAGECDSELLAPLIFFMATSPEASLRP